MVAPNFKYVIFLAVLVIILFLAGTALSYTDFLVSNIYWIILLAIFIIIIWRHDFVLQLLDYQRAVIYRFGKVNRVGGPGWAFLWPIIETYAHVDLRTKTIDVPQQEVVTKDGIELKVDAVIYLKVKKDNQSVVNSIIEVEDYVEAAKLFVVSSVRDVVGSMTLSEVISNIETINTKVKVNLEKISQSWGITIDSVEIKDVQIPDTVLDAMHQEKAAVQQKLARMEKALAHKAEIEAVKEAAAGLDQKALTYYYIRAIENMSKGKGSKVFFPAEFSKLAGAFAGSNAVSPEGKDTAKYKKLLKNYVDSAVSTSKGKKKSTKKKKAKKKTTKKKKKK
jgi:regulator of protease activity HflC (stomatin/prohibitin superfamily)